ncbi:TrmH family RNA methyltransferase [Salinarimonas ramus]|uniref:RNA methyltransferase n=1 Tax=Salinarimonas ramus TaxID=690164 RepID=A0A917V4C5_9HYPH|nr:RNA methyltransferase [Salinarimonas ramus]GGK34839.1 RNA methyltransferase [Salinarimonas ramus]
MIAITDADDPRIADYRAVRERDLVGRMGRFVIEGEVVLRLAVARGRFPLASALLSEKRAGLAETIPAGVPVYVAPQAVMDSVTGFPIHRGVLAVGVRGDAPDPRALLAALPPRALVVALVGLTNHDNVGGIFRNAAAFGADAVILDGETCDPLYRKAIRVSAGGALVVPFARAGDPSALLDLLEEAGFTSLALSPRGADTFATLRPPARAALVLGTEGPGLPDAVMSRARTLRIAMAGEFDSLNVAVTSGIALHALAGLDG